MAKIKGTALIPAVKLVRKNREELLPRLDDAARMLCEERILPGSWYPLDDASSLLLGIARFYGGSTSSAMETLGAYLAQVDLNGMYAHLLRPGDVAKTARRAVVVWRSYMDTGALRFLHPDPGKSEGILRLEDFPQALPYCQCIIGMGRVVIQMAGGGENPSFEETKCTLRGDPLCEFLVRWSPA